jgi:hypothetical protein
MNTQRVAHEKLDRMVNANAVRVFSTSLSVCVGGGGGGGVFLYHAPPLVLALHVCAFITQINYAAN